MQAKGMTHVHYLVTSCLLHNLQTGLRNGVQYVLGEGGTNDNGRYLMNAMQMPHGTYNIQNWQETEELKDLWSFVEEDELVKTKFKKLKEPITTRWWLVGDCAVSFKESFVLWMKICRDICNSALSGSASSKIASCTLNLMQNKVICNDLDLIVSFHSFFCSHTLYSCR